MLVVFIDIWSRKVWAFHEGQRHDFPTIPVAREWALGRGMSIRVRMGHYKPDPQAV